MVCNFHYSLGRFILLHKYFPKNKIWHLVLTTPCIYPTFLSVVPVLFLPSTLVFTLSIKGAFSPQLPFPHLSLKAYIVRVCVSAHVCNRGSEGSRETERRTGGDEVESKHGPQRYMRLDHTDKLLSTVSKQRWLCGDRISIQLISGLKMECTVYKTNSRRPQHK